MASEWKPTPKEINGVNLDNYFPHQRSYNSVVYMHKRYLDDHKRPEVRKDKLKPKKEKKFKLDKGQQFNSEKNAEVSNNYTMYKSNNNNDPVLEQTIQFAKNIVPLVIPPSEDKMPVFYTIKTSKKHRKKEKKHQETSFEHQAATATYEKEEKEKGDGKKVIATYRKTRKESFSVRESLSPSSNTLEDLNINQSCCTLSEVSEKKYYKKENSHHKKQNDCQKFSVSESSEALVTENPGDSKTKIHVINEKDKHHLSDRIKTHILNAIRECISELNICNHNTNISAVQDILKCNTIKLDTILERISCIENKLDSHVPERSSETSASEIKVLPRVQMPPVKGSALEELEEDLMGSKEDYSSEEELHQEVLNRRSKSAVIELVPEDKSENKGSSLGGGEVAEGLKGSYSVGIKPDRPNRIPARFCWTDAARK